MHLPFLSKKQDNKEFFLSLILSPGEIRSILFEKNGESLLILGTHKEEFLEHLDSLTSERIIELSDVVITEIEKHLPEGADLTKTIFAVPDRWVVEGKIIKDQLSKLKQLCDALHLTPVGFIVSTEAIIAYLHKKEGVPVTAIVVELGKKHLTMSLVKNGNILTVKEGELEDSAAVTLEKLLIQQEELEVLPPKIILLNFEHAKKIQQSLLGHSWSKSLQFLHLPQVEVLDPEVESQAVISGVATQMGFNSLPEVPISKIEKKEEPVEVAANEDNLEKPAEEELHEEEEHETTEFEFKGETVGFFKEKDVLKKAKEDVAPVSLDKPEEEPLEDLHAQEETEERHTSLIPAVPVPHLPGLHFKVPGLHKTRGKAIYLYPILVALLFIGVIIFYYFVFEKVQVTVYTDKKGVNKDISVTFSTDKNTSAADSIIHIDTLSLQENGKESQNATGTKETGDKAKGSVTIYNKTDNPETFNQGTVLIGPNNLQFDLTGDVTVASTSSFSTSFSSSDVNVQADNFGKEYNLPSGSNFQIQGQSTSDLFGKNNSAFSGGTKKEITVVSADDLTSLQSKILDTLTKKAMSDGAGKIGDSSKFLTFPLDYSFDDKSYSNKAGDQTDTVSLTATITFKLGSYKNDDLITLAKDITSKDAPTGYSYSGKDSEIQVNNIKNDNGNITGKLVLSSVFLPQVSESEIAAKISGKSKDSADALIKTPGISDDLITFPRSLPFFPKILPFNKNNISVTLATQ